MLNLVTCWRFAGSGFPFDPEEHLAMQWEAFEWWAAIGSNVEIIAHPGQVLWREIAERAARHDVAAQVDGDIILTYPIEDVFEQLRGVSGPAWATSHRWCFDRGQGLADARIGPPWGLSIFVGNRAFWQALLASRVADYSKLGVMDDQAVASFGNKEFPETGFDFTDLRCVFHPNHGTRIENRNEFNAAIGYDLSSCGMPPQKFA